MSDQPDNTAILEVYEELVNAAEWNLSKISEVGKRLGGLGFTSQADHCFDICLEAMHGLIEGGHLDAALWTETLIYDAFVKPIESEEHYKTCFDRWINEFSMAAKSMNLQPATTGQPERICFFLHSGYFLGHTAVLLKVLDDWQQSRSESVDIYVAILTRTDPEFLTALKSRGVYLLRPAAASSNQPIELARAVIDIREQIQSLSIGTVVWVSVPTISSFALNLPMARRQIFWSLKFHPVHYDSVATHICGGHPSEKIKHYHGREWAVCPFPLTVAEEEVSRDSVRSERATLGDWKLILGSMAREEKFNSQDFLLALGQILALNPHCAFIYTGRSNSEHIRRIARQFGVEQQIKFLGWVDTNLYAEVIDIFLETFPFGCGVTAFQAMAKGTPIVSYCADDTMFGYQLKGAMPAETLANLPRSDFERLPILTATDANHYIDIVNRLIRDNKWRGQIGERQRVYYRGEAQRSSEYSAQLHRQIFGEGNTTWR